MTEHKSFHWIVKGKVQGVWFRAGTKEKAEELGLTGWVRNLPDGGVEVLAQGVPAQVAKLQAWLRHGPERAHVEEVIELEALPEDGQTFEVR